MVVRFDLKKCPYNNFIVLVCFFEKNIRIKER